MKLLRAIRETQKVKLVNTKKRYRKTNRFVVCFLIFVFKLEFPDVSLYMQHYYLS